MTHYFVIYSVSVSTAIMEPHTPAINRLDRDRDRSRSPRGSRSQEGAEASAKEHRRGRLRSPSKFKETFREMEANKEKWAAIEKKYEDERTRRRNLAPEERLKEDGEELKCKIENDPDMVVLLEISRSQRALCRAENDC